jgi:hypothetical protein
MVLEAAVAHLLADPLDASDFKGRGSHLLVGNSPTLPCTMSGILQKSRADLWVDDTLSLSAKIEDHIVEKSHVVRALVFGTDVVEKCLARSILGRVPAHAVTILGSLPVFLRPLDGAFAIPAF